MTAPQIAVAVATDEARAIATLALAFATDPATRWAFPDPAQYQTYFPQFVKAFGGRAFEHGTAYAAEDYGGVALWLPPGVSPDNEAMGTLMERAAPMQDPADGQSVMEQMHHHHPAEPHWYLPLIGVAPAHQGTGYGSALLRHALTRCDQARQLAYLESSNPSNVPLYERHGFVVVGTIQAGASPTFYPMVRQPR